MINLKNHYTNLHASEMSFRLYRNFITPQTLVKLLNTIDADGFKFEASFAKLFSD